MCDNLITLEYVAPNGDIQTDLGTAALATFTVLSVEKPEVKFSGPVECQNPDVRTNMAALQPGRDVNQKYQLGPSRGGSTTTATFLRVPPLLAPRISLTNMRLYKSHKMCMEWFTLSFRHVTHKSLRETVGADLLRTGTMMIL